MAQYATTDANGLVTGFYDDALHETIPAGALTLTDSQYQQWVANTAGLVWRNGELVPYTIPLTLAQQAAAALAAGCAIVSTGTPALNGTYACDDNAVSYFTAVQTRINAGLGLPLNAATIAWVDMAGTAHNLTAAQFTEIARAISDYVYELKMVAITNSGALPAQPVTIV